MENNEDLKFPWEMGLSPFHKDNEGVEWYVDMETIKFIKEPDENGISISDVVCFFAKKEDYITRVLIDNNTKQILFESQDLDAIGDKIELLKTNKLMDQKGL